MHIDDELASISKLTSRRSSPFFFNVMWQSARRRAHPRLAQRTPTLTLSAATKASTTPC